jgi:SAM-dependent methyltransferase
MTGAGTGPDVDLVLLAEDQNATFDSEYHRPADFAAKVAHLKELFPGGPKSFLDLGGGNGRFLDKMLEAFPEATGTLVDVSALLLSKNKPHPRKRLIEGSLGELDALLGEQKFDVITINWVLHHLVGPSYDACTRNRAAVLTESAQFLTPGGVVVIAENMFKSPMNAASHIIYAITRVSFPPFVKLARPFFNTAGVGVCFLSEPAWRRQFDSLGLTVVREHFGLPWPCSRATKAALALLLLHERRHGHFYLRPG